MKVSARFLLLSCILLAGPLGRALAADFDEMPVPVKSVAPTYPVEMRREGASGIVTLQIVIDETGNVVERTVMKSTRSEFEPAALQAVQQWKFKPAKKAGVAVRAKIAVPIKFNADV